MYDASRVYRQNNITVQDVPAAPLPPVVGNPEPNSNVSAIPPSDEMTPENIPAAPLSPIVGNPEPNSNVSDAPLSDEMTPKNILIAPVPPIAENSEPNIEIQPPYPGNNPAGFSTVRFLHAASGYGPVNVSIGLKNITTNLPFTNISNYYRIRDGFYVVTITSTRNPGIILFRGRIPFNTNETITLAIIRATNGLNILRISDQSCQNRPRNRGCLRAVNLIYNSPAMDVILTDGRIAFSDVRYKEVTAYKQAKPGEYEYYVAQTPYTLSSNISNVDILDNLPIILTNFFLPGYGNVTPLVSSYVTIQSGTMHTIYMLGNWETSSTVIVKNVENY